MKRLALALTLVVSGCAVVPTYDQKHDAFGCCMAVAEYEQYRFSLSVDPDPLAIKAKFSFKF